MQSSASFLPSLYLFLSFPSLIPNVSFPGAFEILLLDTVVSLAPTNSYKNSLQVWTFLKSQYLEGKMKAAISNACSPLPAILESSQETSKRVNQKETQPAKSSKGNGVCDPDILWIGEWSRIRFYLWVCLSFPRPIIWSIFLAHCINGQSWGWQPTTHKSRRGTCYW